MKHLQRGRPRTLPPEVETWVAELYRGDNSLRRVRQLLAKEGVQISVATLSHIIQRTGSSKRSRLEP